MSMIIDQEEKAVTNSSGIKLFKKPRAYPRSQTVLSASYRIKRVSNNRSETAALTNWSMGGGRLEASRSLEVGTWIDLEIKPGSASDIPIPPVLQKKGWVRARVVCEVPLAIDAQEPNRYVYGIAFAVDWKSLCRYHLEPVIPWIAHFLFVAGIVNVIYLKSFNFYYFWYQPLINLYSLLISFYILSRFILSYLYRPPRDVGYLPSVTVIVACKNEAGSIGRTLDAIYQSDYPQDQMEVIAVNDGSTDGTYAEMERAKERHAEFRGHHT